MSGSVKNGLSEKMPVDQKKNRGDTGESQKPVVRSKKVKGAKGKFKLQS